MRIQSSTAFRTAIVVFGFALTIGCSKGSRPISGGTHGLVTTDGLPMSQIELTVYEDNPFCGEPLGFGAVSNDGSFELIDASRSEKLLLEPRKYRFTIESLGAEIMIPKKFGDPKETVLRCWAAQNEAIVLEADGMSSGM